MSDATIPPPSDEPMPFDMELSKSWIRRYRSTGIGPAPDIDVGLDYFDAALAAVLAKDKTIAELREALRSLRAWDQMPMLGDGPYWAKQIDAILARTAPSLASTHEPDVKPDAVNQ